MYSKIKILELKLVAICFFVCIQLAVFVDFLGVGGFNGQRVWQVIFLVFLLVFPTSGLLIVKKKVVVVVFAIAAFFHLVVFANTTVYSVVSLLLSMLFLILFLVFSTHRLQEKDLNFFLKCMSLSLLSIYLVAFQQYIFFLVTPDYWSKHLLVPHFHNVRFFNHLQVATFLFNVYFGFFCLSSSSLVNIVNKVLAVLTISLVFYSNATGALIALFLQSFLAVYFMCKKKSGRVREVVVPVVSVWIFGWTVFKVFFEYIPAFLLGDVSSEAVLDLNANVRMVMWIEAWNLSWERPLLGRGGMSYADKETWPTELGYGHPHNSIVQIVYEYGYVGLGLVLFSFLGLLKITWTQCKQDIKALLIALSIVGMLVLSLFSGVIVMPLSQLFLCMLFFLFISRTGDLTKIDPQDSLVRISGWSIRIVGGVVALFLLSFLYTSARFVVLDSVVSNAVGPRFWSEGAFYPVYK